MLPSPSNALLLIANLATAREILLRDAKEYMPSAGKEQRDKVVDTLDRTIADVLASIKEPISDAPTVNASVPEVQNAWLYLRQMQRRPVSPTPAASSPYGQLRRAFEENEDLEHAIGILGWVRSTESMRDIPGTVLDEAQKAVDVFRWRLFARPAVGQWIRDVRAQPKHWLMDEADCRNFSLMERMWEQKAGLDETLIGKLSLACSESEEVWRNAKPNSDFNAWLPHLEKVVEYTRQKSTLLGKQLRMPPQQALREGYNPGLREETIDKAYAELSEKVPPLRREIIERQGREAPPLPLPSVPVEAQKHVLLRLAKALGFEESRTRLDSSENAFCTGQWDDVRITSHYDDNFLYALSRFMHEAGHAFYHLDLPRRWKGQQAGEISSVWVDESLSLFWERQVGISEEFMEFLSPLLKKELKVSGPEWEPRNLYRLLTRAGPSQLHTEAVDEAAYPLSMLLRDKIEQQLISGKLQPENLPQAWKAHVQQPLRIVPTDHAHGCMRGIVLSRGMFGYVVGAAFGAFGAAQLMEAMRRDIPDVREHIRKGDFAPLRNWLAQHIHMQGALYGSEELFEKATGKAISPNAWFDFIKERYLGKEIGPGWRGRTDSSTPASPVRKL